ncbi:MAG: hypothetical protein ABFS86_17815 [Planctomycetota bacterium]
MRDAETTIPGRDEERGIALVVVLLVLILCSILALEIKSTAVLHLRLATNKRNDFLMREAMRGQLEVIKQVLLYDLKENQIESLEDSWLDDRYTSFQDAPDPDEERDPEEPISSTGVALDARVEDEARKFNLNNLNIEDETIRKHWEEVFVRLLRLYREDHAQYSISQGKAEELLGNVQEWMKRQGDDLGLPPPSTAEESQVMVTPDELLLVKGFDREMFYDQKPEEDGDPEIPGLYRYLTLWSEGPVNLNTADAILVKALFREEDERVAEDFLAWRDEEAEEQDEDLGLDEDPATNTLKSIGDLKNVDGIDQAVVNRNRLGTTGTVSSSRFSIHLEGEDENGLRRQERWVLLRNPKGFRTLLMESRNDPVVETDEDEEEEEEHR